MAQSCQSGCNGHVSTLRSTWLLPGLALSLALSSSIAAERFNLDYAAKVVNVMNPQITPDGRRVVITVSRANLKENRFDTELVQVDVETRAQRVLTRRQASWPRLSSDGLKLAFIVPVEGKAQVFVLPMDGGEAMQVTHAPTAVEGYEWSPDGKAIAYVASEEPPKREGDEKANRSFDADVNYLLTEAPRSSHLWLVPAEGGEAKRLTSGEWSASGPFYWSPDGKRIAFSYQPGPGARYWAERSSRVVGVESGAVESLTGRPRLDSVVGFSPDGKNVAYTWPRDGTINRVEDLWVAPAAGGPGRNLTRELDVNVNSAQWSSDGQSLLFATQRGTSRVAWIQPLEGSARLIKQGTVTGGLGNLSRDGKIVWSGSDDGRPNELYVMASLDAAPRRLTDFNAEIAALDLGKQEGIRWRGPDNFEMDGVLTFPPGYTSGHPFPLVLLIHGGPQGASSLGFSLRSQWLAANGWVVFEPNYRGSTNLGNAFEAAIWNDAGAGPGRDVMSGVELLIKKGIADPARMAVSGWSYGGYMTVWLLGNYPDRWRAGVAGAAVTDHVDQYAFSDIHSIVATYYGGSPFNDPKRLQAYREQAPITYAARIKAPTLILCDTGDQRVPITESYLLYHVLRDNGVKTKFIAYPVSGHAPQDPIHQRDVHRRWADWIRDHMEPAR